MQDLNSDRAPVLRWRRARKVVERRELPDAGSVRRRIEASGEDAASAAVAFLEALVSAALDTRIDELDAAVAARVLLAEELLLILTGSDDVEAVRAWLRAH